MAAVNATSFTVPWIKSTFSSTGAAPLLDGLMNKFPIWVLLLGSFFGIQVIAVVLNVLRQLVRFWFLVFVVVSHFPFPDSQSRFRVGL
jgi:hypothetical protein